MLDSSARPISREASSFRDPAGYLYWRDGKVYRCILEPYRASYEAARSNGLMEKCVEAGKILPFTVCSDSGPEPCVAVLEPRQLDFVSYPYEWCFDQLKDAALATLDLHIAALDKGMLLKDASAYNIQFVDGRPVLIDHLSFDRIADHGAWPAYGQFCRHFLAPLALMSYVDLGAARQLQLYIDGIPLDLASRLLPAKTRLKPGLAVHLHLHAKMSGRHAGARTSTKTKTLSADQLSALAQSLRSTVAKLAPLKSQTEWGDYYNDTNYTTEAFDAKLRWLREFVGVLEPRTLWDIGGNDGHFSRQLAPLAKQIICLDIDPTAVARNYEICKRDRIENVHPLVFDLCNPSPGIGFANLERAPLFQRGRPDLIVALALIHHIAISNNVPFERFAALLAKLCKHLVIEFVGKQDSQVQRLLVNRQDVFPTYTEPGFLEAFGKFFDVEQRTPIPETHRVLYLLKTKL